MLNAQEPKHISVWQKKKDTMIILRILKNLVTQDLCSPA